MSRVSFRSTAIKRFEENKRKESDEKLERLWETRNKKESFDNYMDNELYQKIPKLSKGKSKYF